MAQLQTIPRSKIDYDGIDDAYNACSCDTPPTSDYLDCP
ncbi:hypothetical protein DSUL_50030 [Desulfovibrionales bacterium]